MVASKPSLENIDNAKAPASSLAAAEKTIEQRNQQLDDILLSYIGSVEKHTQTLWVYEKEEMVFRSVTYVPGWYNIFDEILLNAADNPSMDSIKVVIDADKNQISVCGYGVPVEFHQEECVYMPEMIKKTTGGRNGFGATLTNISTEFIIEIADGKRSLKKYKQVFENNMGKKYDPVITMCNKSENWTKVTFTPDLKKFNMTELDNDVVALMSKRVLEIAGCLGKTVDLNGKQVPIKSFSDYVDLYLSAASKSRTEPLPRMTEKVNDRWEVCVSLSDGRFQQVSFVNSIATIKGGTHVDYVTNQVTKYIVRIVNKKKKYSNVKTHDVKNHLWVFVNALIDNPAFDSQTKERLTLPESSFGSKCQLSKDILQKGLLEHFLFSWKTWEQNEALKISDGAKTETVKVEGLMDAEKAGGEESEACTLILVEGRSAQSLAKLGRNVLGRAFYGAFPIQGKFLNVSKAKTSKIANNELVVNIKKILGLKQGRKYYDAKSLRYGRVMLLSDQDPDGSHIKGLLINYFHHFWPLLLKIKPSFIVQFITPIMKVTHPTKEAQLFYSMLRYEDWESEIRQSGNTTEWTRKYCKGLASIDSADAKGYFTNLKFHQKDFVWEGVQDGEAIKLAFSKNKTGARRKLLSDYKPGTHDLQKPTISFKDFVYNDMGEFSRANLERSIPSLVDGLKPSQRKILFCAFEKNLVEDVLVSKFSGYVLDLSVYRHGEQNLDNTIIGMALDYVGRNNVNLLHPSSQFGTRASGKKDAANPRYIFTKLSPATMVLFPKDDDVLLERLFGDGKKIEPTWYIPIIPTVLVNGAEGIASGWKTFIPNYNPRDIVKNINLLHPSRHFPILQMLSSFDLSGRLNP